MAINLNKVSMVAGVDTEVEPRDPYEINKNLQVSWGTVFGEPEGLRTPDWVWKVSILCYNKVQGCTYKFLTILTAPFLAFFVAINFAFLAYLQVWCLRPFLKLLYVVLTFVRRIWEIFLSATLGPVIEAIGLCFTNIKLRHQRVYDAKDEPQFPYII